MHVPHLSSVWLLPGQRNAICLLSLLPAEPLPLPQHDHASERLEQVKGLRQRKGAADSATDVGGSAVLG